MAESLRKNQTVELEQQKEEKKDKDETMSNSWKAREERPINSSIHSTNVAALQKRITAKQEADRLYAEEFKLEMSTRTVGASYDLSGLDER